MRVGIIRAIFGCALLWACSAPTDTATAVPTQNAATPAPTFGANSSFVGSPALWRVADEDTTVFLFGTIHILRPDINWLRDDVRQAVKDADAIYFEADVDSTAAQRNLVEAVTDLGLYTDGTTLGQRLDEDQRREVAETLELLGIPETGFDNMRPWLASIQMSDVHLTRLGFDRDSGVERVLNQEAMLAGVPTRFLETGARQVELLASISEDSQIDMLVETAKQIEDDPVALDRMIVEWLEGDEAELGQLIMKDETFASEEAAAIMLTNRNEDWARQIDELMEKEAGQFVVAVGAAHLVGEGSLQEQLVVFGHSADRL